MHNAVKYTVKIFLNTHFVRFFSISAVVSSILNYKYCFPAVSLINRLLSANIKKCQLMSQVIGRASPQPCCSSPGSLFAFLLNRGSIASLHWALFRASKYVHLEIMCLSSSFVSKLMIFCRSANLLRQKESSFQELRLFMLKPG